MNSILLVSTIVTLANAFVLLYRGSLTIIMFVYIQQNVTFNIHTCTPMVTDAQSTWSQVFTDFNCFKMADNLRHIHQMLSNNMVRFSSPEPYSRRRRNVVKSSSTRTGAANSTAVHGPEEKSTEYAVFALVPVFCVMGLLGILICNLLKKKGFRCNAEKDAVDEECATPEKEGTI